MQQDQVALTTVQETIQFIRGVPVKADAISPSGVESQELVAGGTIFLKKEIVAPKAAGIPHYHPCQTAIYIIVGEVRVDYGPNMEYTEYVKAGDAIFIPAGVVHRPVNVSETVVAECLVARDMPTDVVIPLT